MANEFVKRDYNLISGGTSNHCMLIDLRNKDITGKEAENALVKGDITVNKNMVPFDTQSPFVTSGMRVGTPAITTRGLVESDMIKVVDYIDQVIKNPGDESIHKEVKNEINNWMKAYSLYPKVSYPKSELV
jgi:glycine hydroxymethyltransferase